MASSLLLMGSTHPAAGHSYKDKLMACAAAIRDENLIIADSILSEIKSLISAETNQARKKVVNYYAEALVRRVYGIHPSCPLPLLSSYVDVSNYLFRPYHSFADVTTRHAIKDAFTGNKRLHVINFSIMEHPRDWYYLMEELSTRQRGDGIGLSSFRLTTIRPKLSIHFHKYFLQQTRQQITRRAEELQIDFKMRQLLANYKSADDIIECCMSKLTRTSQDEMLVVLWSYSLHKLLSKEGGAIEKVLLKMKDLKPDMMVIVEQEANHNDPDFLDRLDQSFQYYSSVFESLDKDDLDVPFYRELWERYFRRQIGNVMSCEGIDRVERHESLALWQQRLTHAGFLPVPQHLDELKNRWKMGWCLEYRIEEKDGHALLCRKNCPHAVTSIWKPIELSQSNAGLNVIGQDVAEFDQFPPIEELDKAISFDFDDDNADDPSTLMTGRNQWFMGGLSMNQIASSAKIFDILEYECHKYKLPIALAWISSSRCGNINSEGKRLLRVEETACYLNDFRKEEFLDACISGALEEGQGVAGKALLSGRFFVPDISVLDVADYPFVEEAEYEDLRAAVAIRLISAHTCNEDYVLEFFLPEDMKENSEQIFLIDRIFCTLHKECRNLWKVCDRELNGFNLSEGRFEGVTMSNIPQAAVSNRAEIVPFVTSNRASDGVETRGPLHQEPGLIDGKDPVSVDNAKQAISANKRQRESSVWKGFTKKRRANGEVWAACNSCNNKYRAESTRGTSNLHKHLKKCLSKRQGNAEESSLLIETEISDADEFIQPVEPPRKKQQAECSKASGSGPKDKAPQSELPQPFPSHRTESLQEGRAVQPQIDSIMSSLVPNEGAMELQNQPDPHVTSLMSNDRRIVLADPTVPNTTASSYGLQYPFQLPVMANERMLTDLQKKLIDMTKPIESPISSNEDTDTTDPSNLTAVPGPSEAEIRAAEVTIKSFLAGGLEILKLPAEVTKTREACEFLTSPQLVGTMSMQRKGAVYCLKSELDNLISKLYGANMVLDKENELKSRQGQCQGVAAEKLKEIDHIQENMRITFQELATLKKHLAEVQMTVLNRENKLQTLESRSTEIAMETQNLQAIAENFAAERERLSTHIHKAKKDWRYVEENWKSIRSLFGDI